MKMDIETSWEFAPTGGGDGTGVNDPVTTTFKGSAASLARESIQNIIDAHDPDSELPSEAEFILLKRNASDLPKMGSLKDKFRACAELYKNIKDAAVFFTRAANKIERDEYIDILKIGDYNTVGLTGGDEEIDGNYYSLMKSVGSSFKSGSTGGHFGLGKGAYFASSLFRTIFLSSMCGPDNFVFQGKSRISSFKEDGKMKQGNGSFGLPEQLPIRDYQLIPKMFRRDQRGTDFYIVGFEDTHNWQKNIIRSILNFFWLSFIKNRLLVKVDRENISVDNIDSFITENYWEGDPDRPPDKPNPIPYYLAYTSSCSKVFEEELETLGKVRLYLLQKDGYPRKVAYIRSTGMVIQKKSFNSMSDFAGVFVCEDSKGNELLKKMENPEHSEWRKENAKETSFYYDAKRAESEMSEFIKSSIKEISSSDTSGRLTIGGLEEFLSLPDDEEGQPRTHGQEESGSGNESAKEKTKESTENMESVTNLRRLAVLSKDVTKGSPGDDAPVVGGGKPRGGGKNRDGSTGEGDLDVFPLENVKYRSFSYRGGDGRNNHIIVLKGPLMMKLKLELKAGTDDAFDSVNISEARDLNGGEYKFSGSKIYGLSTGPTGEVKINVLFDSGERYSLNVTAYEDK